MGSFPPLEKVDTTVSGVVVTNGCPANTANPWVGQRGPCTVLILPFMEQNEIYSKFNFALDFPTNNSENGGNVNFTEATTQNAAFQCPSDPLATGYYSSYLPVTGGGTPTGCPCVSANDANFILYTNGVFFINSATRVLDITDGTANTYLIGESHYMVTDSCNVVDPAVGWPFLGCKASFWAGGVYLNTSWRYYVNAVAAVDPINSASIGGGQDDETMNCDEASVGRVFGSRHPGGCNAAFADGHIQFMLNSLNVNVHRSLGNMADGGPTGGF